MSFSNRIRRLDVFKKFPKEVSQATNLGGLLSIVTTLLILYFLVVEFRNYLNPTYSAQLTLDDLLTREEMSINLDISFPRFPCELISLDVTDVMISHHPNLGSVAKRRLDKFGNYIQNHEFELLREHNFNKQFEMVLNAIKQEYGCRLTGQFTVKEVPGNFHISMHAYYNLFMMLKLDGVITGLEMSHTIHQLYFGHEHHIDKIRQLHPEASLNVLYNTTKVYKNGENAHYHLDIVPTWYHESEFTSYRTYQYTSAYNEFSMIEEPIVHFNYHIGGLNMQIVPLKISFFSFLAHICAVVGGTYAIVNALHNLLSKLTSPTFQYQLIA